MQFNAISLPFEDIAVIDAAGLANAGDDLYIKYVASTGKYYLETRDYSCYEVQWDMHFRVSLEQAREIVRLGYAHWWMVPPEFQ